MTDAIQRRIQLEQLWSPRGPLNGGALPTMPVTGIVVSADDPLNNGRLRVFCPALHDDPRNPESIPWALYVSPMYGQIDDQTAVRGPTGARTKGAVSYGFWAIPEVGAEVLIFFVNGDPAQRVWTGCIPKHQSNNSYGHGRYVWATDALPDGPFSGGTSAEQSVGLGDRPTDQRIQPLYDNLTEAFSGRRTSAEWRTRGADIQGIANTTATTYTRSTDQRPSAIQDTLRAAAAPGRPLRDHEASIVTGHGYGWSSIRNGISNTSRVSRVYGFSTPGFHSFTMDDRHGSCRVRIRTTSGTQLLLDDTNERMYVSTALGKSYFELDWNGNIDFFGERRLSFTGKKGINFTTDDTIRLHGKRGIHLVAGPNDLPEEEQNESAVPADGQIRLHAQDDIHLVSDRNIRTFSGIETLITATSNMQLKTDASMFSTAKQDIHVKAVEGSIIAGAQLDISGVAARDILMYAENRISLNSRALGELNVFAGKLNIASGGGALLKVMGGAFDMQAIDGDINVQTQNTNVQFGRRGILGATTGQVLHEGQNVEARSRDLDAPPPEPGEAPPTTDCNLGEQVPLGGSFTREEDYVNCNIDVITRACYNAGFRGESLVMMVAIVGQESSFGRNIKGPPRTDSGRSTVNDPKWYPSCMGAFQMRVLRRPQDYTGLDRQRTLANAMDLQASANWSFSLSNGGTNFTPWSGYTDGGYAKFMNQARQAVARLCGNSAATSEVTIPLPDEGAPTPPAAPGTVVGYNNAPSVVTLPSSSPSITPPPLPSLDVENTNVSAMKISLDTFRIQGRDDIMMKTSVDDITTSVQCLRVKMDDIVGTFNKSVFETLGFINEGYDQIQGMISSMASSLITGLAQAANETTPTAAIATMTQVVDDIQDLVALIGAVNGAIGDFAGARQTLFRGIDDLTRILDFDMDMSLFVPAEITQLAYNVERTFVQIREADSLLGVADAIGLDTRTPPTPSTPCD